MTTKIEPATDHRHALRGVTAADIRGSDGVCTPYTRVELMIDQQGQVHVGCGYYNSHGDHDTIDRWHDLVLTWRIPADFGFRNLRYELSPDGKLSGLIDRVEAGHSAQWDGNNHVGVLTSDAAAASDQIKHMFGIKVVEDDFPEYDPRNRYGE